jgi:hypothetical protein
VIWTRLYDPNRTPSHWSELIREGQYAVFVLDARIRLPRDFNGEPFGPNGDGAVGIAEDLSEAGSSARGIVARHPELCCEIYDHEGKSGPPLEVVYEESVRGRYVGLPVARRETMWGSFLFCCGIGFVALDVSRDLLWMWGYIVGLKLCLVGGSFLVRGVAGMYEHRKAH